MSPRCVIRALPWEAGRFLTVCSAGNCVAILKAVLNNLVVEEDVTFLYCGGKGVWGQDPQKPVDSPPHYVTHWLETVRGVWSQTLPGSWAMLGVGKQAWGDQRMRLSRPQRVCSLWKEPRWKYTK